MTKLCALKLKSKTPRARDGDSLSSYIPGSQTVALRLSPASKPASKWSLLALFGELSQQFPYHNLCTEFIICQSVVKNIKKKKKMQVSLNTAARLVASSKLLGRN